MTHPVVIAVCKNGHKRTIHAGEIPEGAVPLCNECGRLITANWAHDCNCDRA